MTERETKDSLISEEEFHLLRDLICREFGISLKGDRRLTLHTKISHRLGVLGLPSYRDYYEYIIRDSTREELFALASHITNNETYFFREKSQLDTFSLLLPDIKKNIQLKNKKTLRILSLACSSGEEAYTLNIIIQESGLFAWNWETNIIGIDIDRIALAKARHAYYTKNSFRGINGNAGEFNKDFIRKYFLYREEQYALRNFYMRNIEFRHGNILDCKSFEDLKDIDVIFCRNVIIYMSDTSIEKAVGNIHNSLSDNGYLFVGSSESLINKTGLFVPEYINSTIVYRKNVQN
ncbi:MAG: protein-glutamate O-methyltransferase CheR [Nitrospirota bacterium]